MQKIYVYFALMLCLFFCLPVCVSAAVPEELPSLPVSEFENSGYVVFYHNSTDTTYLYFYDKNVVSSPFVSAIAGSGNFQANLRFLRSAATDSEWLYIYKLSDDGIKWSLISYVSSDGANSQYYNAVIDGDGRYPESITTKFIYSTDDIIWKDCYGSAVSDFFPLSRFPVTLQEAVTTGLQGLMITIQSSAVLLTSLGIGLMALLILVILLSTKFRQFLS